MPEWARRLVEVGEKPPRDTEAWSGYVNWLYFDAATPGLPRGSSEEGMKLVLRAQEPG